MDYNEINWSEIAIVFGMIITLLGIALFILDRYMALMPKTNFLILGIGLIIMFIGASTRV